MTCAMPLISIMGFHEDGSTSKKDIDRRIADEIGRADHSRIELESRQYADIKRSI